MFMGRILDAFFWLLLLAPASGWCQGAAIISVPVGECTLSFEADSQWHALRLRVHHPRFQPCHVDQKAVLSILAAAFAKIDSHALQDDYTSLFIGRLIDYPWLSQYLADTAHRDKRWNKKKGRPINMDINAYVASVLGAADWLTPIQSELTQHGYDIVGVSVEKVLVGGFGDRTSRDRKKLAGRTPFDAQVWFRLRKY